MTPDRSVDPTSEGAENAVLEDTQSLDISSLGLSGTHTAQVSVTLPGSMEEDLDDEDVLEDEVPYEDLYEVLADTHRITLSWDEDTPVVADASAFEAQDAADARDPEDTDLEDVVDVEGAADIEDVAAVDVDRDAEDLSEIADADTDVIADEIEIKIEDDLIVAEEEEHADLRRGEAVVGDVVDSAEILESDTVYEPDVALESDDEFDSAEVLEADVLREPDTVNDDDSDDAADIDGEGASERDADLLDDAAAGPAADVFATGGGGSGEAPDPLQDSDPEQTDDPDREDDQDADHGVSTALDTSENGPAGDMREGAIRHGADGADSTGLAVHQGEEESVMPESETSDSGAGELERAPAAALDSRSSRRGTNAEVALTSRRIDELGGGGESADLLTVDRLLDPNQVVRPEPEGAWQHFVYRLSGHRINLGDSRRARARKELDRRIAAPLSGGARFVPVLSRKGGVGKTTVTTLLGMALADARDDRVIAIDANPDRGTLAERIARVSAKTVRDLARASGQVVGFNDLSAIVARDETRLDIVASDTDPHVSEAFGGEEYNDVANLAAHYYSVVLTDTGTGIVHSVMEATLERADQIVIVSGLSIDEARLASETLTWLETNGYEHLVREAVVILNNSRPGAPLVREGELISHFRTRARAVVSLPYDPRVAAGSAITFRELGSATRDAAREAAATIVHGLRTQAGS